MAAAVADSVAGEGLESRSCSGRDRGQPRCSGKSSLSLLPAVSPGLAVFRASPAAPASALAGARAWAEPAQAFREKEGRPGIYPVRWPSCFATGSVKTKAGI